MKLIQAAITSSAERKVSGGFLDGSGFKNSSAKIRIPKHEMRNPSSNDKN